MWLSKKIKRTKGNEKCAQPALMLVTWDTVVSVNKSAIVVMANMAKTGKTVQVIWFNVIIYPGLQKSKGILVKLHPCKK